MDRPDCYKCKWRRSIPGDTHSSCHHPAFDAVHRDPLAQIIGLLPSSRAGNMQYLAVEGSIAVRGKAHGIRMGWFRHPINFDPIWLEECSGFTAKD